MRLPTEHLPASAVQMRLKVVEYASAISNLGIMERELAELKQRETQRETEANRQTCKDSRISCASHATGGSRWSCRQSTQATSYRAEETSCRADETSCRASVGGTSSSDGEASFRLRGNSMELHQVGSVPLSPVHKRVNISTLWE